MRAAVQRELVRFGELLGICAIAIAQPVLDVFGKAPEQFAFRSASANDILLLPILIVFVPAAVVWMPGALTRLGSRRVGGLVHLAAVAAVLYVGLLQVLHTVFDVDGIPKAGLAAGGAVAGAWLFQRFSGVRLWTRFLSIYAVVLVGLFLFTSPSGELAFAEPPEVVELGVDDASTIYGSGAPGDDAEASAPRFPDIVMIVLDELPTALLVDESGGIDPLRYPAVAEFAADATWYRRYTTVSADTLTAVPALLSGQLPSESSGPLWTQQPDNLFRLLGGVYHLSVSETVTRLCPEAWCGRSPATPPSPTTTVASGSVASSVDRPPAVDTPAADSDRGGLTALVGDATDLWIDQISLDRDDQPLYAGFGENAVVPDGTDDVDGIEPTEPTDEFELDDVPETTDDNVAAVERDAAVARYFGVFDRVGQAPRVDQFRSALTPSPEPVFAFLHLVLPHQPFLFSETGATYAGPSFVDATSADWDEIVLAERMSLQMQFTDGLVGDILDDLRQADLYDDALIVVTGDHGASLDRSKGYRTYDGTNASELMVTPLLIKTPRQSDGVVSDAPIESIDVVPTLADLLDIDVPWTVDGESVLTRTSDVTDPSCGDTRRYAPVGDEPGDGPIELCAADVVPAGLEPLLAPARPTDEWATSNLTRHSPYADLLGEAWGDLDARPDGPTFVLETPGARDPASPPVGVIEGSVGSTSAQWVAVAVDGRIAGISPLYDRDPGDGTDRADHFAIIVPSPLLDTGGYDIRVATLETVDGALAATELVSDD